MLQSQESRRRKETEVVKCFRGDPQVNSKERLGKGTLLMNLRDFVNKLLDLSQARLCHLIHSRGEVNIYLIFLLKGDKANFGVL